jgi:hypothetical protein
MCAGMSMLSGWGKKGYGEEKTVYVGRTVSPACQKLKDTRVLEKVL